MRAVMRTPSLRFWIFLALAAAGAFAFVRQSARDAFVVTPEPATVAPERHPAREAPASVEEDVIDPHTQGKFDGGRWPAAGDRWIYRFERKAMATFQGKIWLQLALGGRAAIERVPVRGESGRLPVEGGPTYYLLTSEIDRLEMQGQSRRETRRLPAVRFEVEPSGRVRELRYVAWDGSGAPRVADEDADVVKDLVSQWLFFEPETRLGRAEARWQDPPARGELRTVTKRIARYPGRPEISKLDSVHEWTTQIGRTGSPLASARVDRLEGTENFTLASANGDFDQRTSYRWLWTSTERATPLAAIATGAAFAVSGVSGSAEAENARAVPTGPALAAAWRRVARMAPTERLRFFRDAKRFLERRSAAGDAEARAVVSLLVKDLRGKAPTSVEWRTGVGLLAATSNGEAQGALHALYREPTRSADEKLSILAGVAAGEGEPVAEWKDTIEKQLAAGSATASGGESVGAAVPSSGEASPPAAGANSPSPEALAELAVREASIYALGGAIRKATDPSTRSALEGVLWREIKEARTESAQLIVLDAIGNSGSGEYVPYLKEQSESSSARVRAKTALALRFLAAEQANPLLERAKSDPSPLVRKAAAQTAAFQTETREE